MIRLPTALALVLLAACNDKDGDTVDTDKPVDTGDTDIVTTTDTTPPEPPTWQVTGQVGNVLAVHTLESKFVNESYRVTAVFADALQGFATAAGCMTRDGLCIQELPGADDSFVDTTKEFQTDSRDYTWNGFSVTVDVLEVPYINDGDDIEYYDAVVEGPPLQTHPAVAFSGEWGNFLSTDGLVVPTLTVTEPAASDNLDVTDGFATVKWTPGGEGQPFLIIIADDFTRVYRLADDGDFEIDWAALGLGEEIPDVYLARWSTTTADVNGNTLDLVGVEQQKVGVQVCDDFPKLNVNGSKGAGNLGTQPNYLTVNYSGLVYDNALHDYVVGQDPVSTVIDFEILDINLQPLCSILYDASVNSKTKAWVTDNGLALWQGWDIDLPEGQGQSTCGSVDETVFGSRDLRTYIEQFSWGVGVGEMSAALESDLSVLFDAQWPVVQPSLHAFYFTMDGTTAQEAGFGRNFDLDGCYALAPGHVPDEVVPSGSDLPDSLFNGIGIYAIDIQP